MKPRRLFVFVPFVLALFIALPVFANTITVTNSNDSGPGSLRNAISLAVPGDTIDFNLTYPATIALVNTLNITTNLTIIGPGASDLAISGNNAVEVVRVNSGITVGISGITLENGKAASGGGIYINGGTLTLTDSAISDNAASNFGGGIYNQYGTLTLTNTTVSDNWATIYGGGIFNSNGTLTLRNSTVSSNSTSFGGGIFNTNGTLMLTDSTVSDNSAPYGGGIFNYNHGTLTLSSSTVSGNSAGTDGGGIYNYNYGKATLTNTTVSGDSSGHSAGGILNFADAELTLTNSTVSGNSSGYGGGISNNRATLLLKSSIVSISSGGNCLLSGGTATSDGYNLSDDDSCSGALNSVTDRNGASPGLDSEGLQDNGGPTKTVALLSTSVAVDAIPMANCTLAEESTTIAADQRGIKRPEGSACDIGAFELVESVPFSFSSAKLDIRDDSSFDLNSKFTLGAGNDGINPLAESVKLQVGPFEVIIPAQSFHQLKNGKKKGSYVFSGEIGSTSIAVQIVPLGDSSYQFKAEGSPVNTNAIANPVTITLTIGQDTGTTLAYADF
jgi:hypothetical protein